MKIALGTFTRSGLEAHFGPDLEAGLDSALRHYTRRLRSGKPPIGVPTFARGQAPTATDDAIELDLERELEEALEAEAERQGVSTGVLLSHAVVVYLADLDANVGESRSSRVEEGMALSRYQRICAFSDTRLPASARRQVGSA